MDIRVLKSERAIAEVNENWNLLPLLELLRDPSIVLTMKERLLAADIIEGVVKRPRGKPYDAKRSERVRYSYLEFLKCLERGDQRTYAYEFAAAQTGQTVRSVITHVKEVEDGKHSLIKAFGPILLAAMRDNADGEAK